MRRPGREEKMSRGKRKHTRQNVAGGGGWGLSAYQAEGIVRAGELLHGVLLQHHHVVQVGGALAGAVFAVDHVRLPAAALARHKQQIEHLQLQRKKETPPPLWDV